MGAKDAGKEITPGCSQTGNCHGCTKCMFHASLIMVAMVDYLE